MDNLIIKTTKIRERKGVAWIDCSSNYGRLRFSSGEAYEASRVGDLSARVKDLALAFLKGKNTTTRAKIAKEELKECKTQSFKEFAEEFLRRRCASLKPQTLYKYQTHIKVLSRKIPYAIALLDQAEYDEVARTLSRPELELLNRIISYARECALVCAQIELEKRKRLQSSGITITPLTLEEVKLLLAHVAQKVEIPKANPKEATRWLEFRNYLATALFTGARVGELLALTPSDIDFENAKIYIGKSKLRSRKEVGSTKTGKARYIDMLDLAREALESQITLNAAKPKQSARVFDFTEQDLAKRWKQVLRECELAPRVLYQTRHSFATIMLTHEEEPLWISAMLGHSSLHTTFTHYVKYIPQRKKRAKFLGGLKLGSGGGSHV